MSPTAQTAAGGAPGPAIVAIMLTRRCDIACGHCSVVSGPDVRGEPEEAELMAAVRSAAAAGARSVQLTGGEPMLREKVVLDLLREATRLGLGTVMTTNGSWGATPEDARRRLRMLVEAGLQGLTVSYDRWHEEQLGDAPVKNVAQAAAEISFPIQVNVVRGADDAEIGRFASQMSVFPSVRLRFYDAQPIGRAKGFETASLRGELEGFCRAAWFPALTDDGRLTTCNGPSYFAKATSPLVLGSTRETPLAELIARHRDDPVLQTIRAFGPAGLRAELGRIPGFESFPFRERYGGMCELCLHVTSDPAAVAALRERLAEPRRAAERMATLRLIEEARGDGTLGTRRANGVGGARVFFEAARSAASRLPEGADRVLGRADFDWKRRADNLIACGLARPLARLLDDRELSRWAPRFFIEELRAAALHSAMVDLVKREVLEHVDRALADLGATGVLLKGTAMLAATPVRDAGRLRGTGDIDLLATGGRARELRRLLLERGFAGERDTPRSADHHLAPISLRGVPLEIHERILPRAFALPEDDLVARSRAVEGSAALRVLDDEGFVLHTLMHCTAHVFAFGSKTAWDLAWTLDRNPALDWRRIAGWARASALPRAFFTPLRALAAGLELAVPREVLADEPDDRRQRALDTVAGARVFAASEGPFDLNPFSKAAVFLLLCDSWWRRIAYTASLAQGDAAEARRSARRHAPAQSLSRLPQQLREAAFHWRAFRDAAARS